ncbi:BTAD domain-containing putative transcriptional regulator [Rhizobium sp. CNPSo 4039]|uniref:BTAD domain-containing putative transcriptional regulator n=1 Tax=Rhizobium sp. CNPSo 4039 TaxID=3021409 RepID=UPI00254D9140|nr:BTAD domain-containing putative transcriptional regulator [Rhizobium sp. CNPSo 4039]MDK4717632.1 BTAD domain-containing putative transcriptional regulator [Rhizobium sp. CNPSo 4039]
MEQQVLISKGNLFLLGRPTLKVDSHEILFPEKAFLLAGLIAFANDRRIEREVARQLLWSSPDAAQRAGNLRQLINRIQSVDFKGIPPVLAATGDYIALNTTFWEIDLLVLASREAPLSKKNWRVFSGELLEGISAPTSGVEEWLTFQRQRVDESRTLAIEQLLMRCGTLEPPETITLAERLVEIDSANEAGWRAIMTSYARLGDLPAARKAYLRCKHQLVADYHAEPDRQTIELARGLGISRDGSVAQSAELPESTTKAAADEQPRVVVLPPDTILTDPLISRLGRALLEDVTVGLSHQRIFKVIAAHTSMEMVHRSISFFSTNNLPPEMRFDYSVYVTIQGEADEIYATCRLTKVLTSEVLWAIDLPLDVQKMSASFGQLAKRIAKSVTGAIEQHELGVPIDEVAPSAYRLYLEGKQYLNKMDLPRLRQARKWFKSSVKRCDRFSPAHAGISRSLAMEWLVRGMKESELLDVANQSAQMARAVDPVSGRAFRELGFIALYRRQFGESLEYFQQAQELNPSDADVLIDYSDALSHSGDLDVALEVSREAFRLNPLPPEYYYWIAGSIHYVRGEFEKAIQALDPVKSKEATARLLAACHAMAKNNNMAARYAKVVRENFPTFRSDDIRAFVPDKDPAHTELLIRGLQLAGL